MLLEQRKKMLTEGLQFAGLETRTKESRHVRELMGICPTAEHIHALSPYVRLASPEASEQLQHVQNFGAMPFHPPISNLKAAKPG